MSQQPTLSAFFKPAPSNAGASTSKARAANGKSSQAAIELGTSSAALWPLLTRTGSSSDDEVDVKPKRPRRASPSTLTSSSVAALDSSPPPAKKAKTAHAPAPTPRFDLSQFARPSQSPRPTAGPSPAKAAMDVDGEDDDGGGGSDDSLPDAPMPTRDDVQGERDKAKRHEAFKRKLLGTSSAAMLRRRSGTDDEAPVDDDADDSPPPTTKAKGKGKAPAKGKGGKGKEKEIKYTPLEQQILALKEKYVRRCGGGLR